MCRIPPQSPKTMEIDGSLMHIFNIIVINYLLIKNLESSITFGQYIKK